MRNTNALREIGLSFFIVLNNQTIVIPYPIGSFSRLPIEPNLGPEMTSLSSDKERSQMSL